MENNHGYRIEEAMKKWFKGKEHSEDCVDFQTRTSLYEVKSCNLFTKCTNGNQKRPYVYKPHKHIVTTQMGRFFIKMHNHKRLKIQAEEEKKIPKYIFVVVIGKQKVWRVKSWKQVNSMVHNEKRVGIIRIKDLFDEHGEAGDGVHC